MTHDHVIVTQDEAYIKEAQALRAMAFRSGSPEPDSDRFDQTAHHVLIYQSGQLACCFRYSLYSSGASIDQSYTAQFYDLSSLAEFDRPLLELGRFCLHPMHKQGGTREAALVMRAWAEVAQIVDAHGVAMLFGCSSFMGADAALHHEALTLLKERHLAPPHCRPRVKAPRIFPFAHALKLRRPNLKAAMQAMPPLLRSYLGMGGWVSDHAVLDDDLNTLHVFTGLEVAKIPPTRARALRLLMQSQRAEA